MKILITGGAGFQGSHLAEHLVKMGHEVTILNTWSPASERNIQAIIDHVRPIWGSVTDAEIVAKSVRGHDAVFHLAARINVDESIADPSSHINVNINGTLNVLKAVTAENCRLIHASTCEVYGAPREGELITETSELRPFSPYAASKAAADRLCFSFHKTYGTKVVIVRPFNIFGERQKESGGGAVIPIFVKNVLDGNPLKIFGGGEQTRDYMHISDLVRAYSLVLEADIPAGEVVNFATGRETSIKDIAAHIAARLNGKIEYAEARRGEVPRFSCDIGKLLRHDFQARKSIFEGIDSYIDWRRNQPDLNSAKSLETRTRSVVF